MCSSSLHFRPSERLRAALNLKHQKLLATHWRKLRAREKTTLFRGQRFKTWSQKENQVYNLRENLMTSPRTLCSSTVARTEQKTSNHHLVWLLASFDNPHID